MSGSLLYFGPSGIGDWCFIWPSLPALMEAGGCDRLSIVVPYRNPGNELLARNPLVAELRWLHRAGGAGLPGYGLRLLRLLRAIRREGHRAVAVSYLSNQPDFLLLARLSGIPRRIGLASGGLARRTFTHPVRPGPEPGKVALHAAYAGALGGGASAVVREPPPLFPPELVAGGEALAERHRLGRDYLVLGIGGGREARWRFWPAGHYRELIERLPERRFVLLGGGADDRRQADEILGDGLPNAVDLVDRISMAEALPLLRGAAAVIGNDSGLANIAATLGTRTLCLYGPSDPRLTGPALVGAEPLAVAVACGPCFGDDQDPATARACGHRRCLAELTSERVAGRLDRKE